MIEAIIKCHVSSIDVHNFALYNGDIEFKGVR